MLLHDEISSKWYLFVGTVLCSPIRGKEVMEKGYRQLCILLLPLIKKKKENKTMT